MIEITATRRIKYKRFNRFSKFVLIGNGIDGFVTSGVTEFKNFEDVKKRLKAEVESIVCYGEWDLKFFEVPDNYKIDILYDYYKVPSEGNLLFEMNYCWNMGDIIKLHVDDSMIHFYFLSEEVLFDDNAETYDEYLNVEVVDDFLTILLFSRDVKKRTDSEIYTMDEDSYLERRGATSFHDLENDNYRDYGLNW